ncbi:Excinuclease ABC C subunit domain protein [Elusimicrobium minutum Pei191]|uniref:Excinuclease ABC C subunit domain protein n=1 Tax=Elusimicrobium minutum (strain Pei191) TaxID=445932 RepID=B2KBS4_ELUMP|nr:excinuclease ABC subunit UvrC [Elusimicrobium minutum]ACC97761.1 Excinuclease ABC C subunit domain protein [Elusimicrobium minutum Pei191]
MSVNFNILPKSPGVYIMRSGLGEVLYIGKAKNLAARVRQYFLESNLHSRGWLLPSLLPLVAKIDYIVAASERDALVLESRLIKKYKPFFNTDGKDDKSYPYIKISDEDFPRGLLTRNKKGPGEYYGPHPNAFAIKSLLRFLWTSGFAPLRPCKWNFSLSKPLDERKIRTCVYFHTGQCPAPCAGKISYKDYQKIVQRFRDFAEGNFGKMKHGLAKAMKMASKNMDYESAARYRDFLNTLERMSERILVSEYKDEKILSAIDASSKVKRLGEVLGFAKVPRHIETFDTSGLYGRYAVGSMVCYIDGKKHHAHYRRFKIKSVLPGTGNDDFLMMTEIVGRRLAALKKAGGALPDLMVIDGGKGQLGMAEAAAQRAGVKMKFISLAKREEEIFVTGRSESIKLPIGDPALNLLMEMRDEVHRFGITYHRHLRDKNLLEDK